MARGTLEERVAYLVRKSGRALGGYGELWEAVQRVAQQLSLLDQKVYRFRNELSGRIQALDRKTTRQFMWTVGIQITVLVAGVGAPGAVLARG